MKSNIGREAKKREEMNEQGNMRFNLFAETREA
jgi:hypothetical protein